VAYELYRNTDNQEFTARKRTEGTCDDDDDDDDNNKHRARGYLKTDIQVAMWALERSKNHSEITEPHKRKALNQGATENSHIGHCTNTSERTDVKYSRFNIGNRVICNVNGNYRIAAILYSLET
jgi:hypothetical protein